MAFIGPVIVLLAAGFALLGVVMIVRGLRGRRVGNTPHCRRCDYVVDEALLAAAFGRGVAASPKCPECGAVLRAGDAIRQGERRRRPMMAVAGLVLLLVGVPVVLAGAGGFLSSATITKHAPTGLLLWQVRQGSQRMVDGGLAELVARNINGKLVATEQREILDALIERFERPSNGWSAQCQEAFSTFEPVAGPLTRAEMERLARGVQIVATIQHRDRVHAGMRMPIVVDMAVKRPPPKEMMVQCVPRSVRLGENSIEATDSGNFRYRIGPEASDRVFTRVLHARTNVAFARGVHMAEVDLEISLWTGLSEPQVGNFSVSYRNPIEVVDDSVPLVAEVSTPPPTEIKNILNITGVAAHSWPKGNIATGSVMPTFRISRQPKNDAPRFCFDVFIVPDPVREPHMEFQIGSFLDSWFGSMNSHLDSSSVLFDILRSKQTVRVVLRSNGEKAMTETLHDSIWSGEVVYDDVPLELYVDGAPLIK